MDADYYLDTVRIVFQEFALVNGTWDVISEEGELERVRPEDIKTTAHFTIEGELDDISGSGQTEAAHGLCYNVPKSRQKHLEVEGAGHYGIFAGRRWREAVYPQLRDFIKQFDDGPRLPKSAAKKSRLIPAD
jgi:poly(3-hydroxybutyrate) depolymerase